MVLDGWYCHVFYQYEYLTQVLELIPNTGNGYWCIPDFFFLTILQSQYGNPMIYVTENGVSEKMLCTDLCDDWRMKYYKDYINEMLKGKKKQKNFCCRQSHCVVFGL